MKRHSLSARLLSFSALSTIAALVVTSIVFNQLFEDYFQKRLRTELENFLQQLTSNLSVSENGEIAVEDPSDIRFSQPLSGLYWQIKRENDETLVSRSLWDNPMDVPTPEENGVPVMNIISSQDAEPLLAVSWNITINPGGQSQDLLMTVATNHSEIAGFAAGFRRSIGVWLAFLAAALILATWMQVWLGLRPLDTIRAEVRKVRNDTERRLAGKFPSEVAPLVDEVNELLEGQQKSIEQARHQASDLAHGLKTPLTVMRALAHDVQAAGQADISMQIEEQIEAMGTFVERELARSRSNEHRKVWSEIEPVAQRMVRAVSKMPGSHELTWEMDIPPGLKAPFDAHDLSEFLGNLLDNARKNAEKTILLSALQNDDGHGMICVIDDGPGIPDHAMSSALKRGSSLNIDASGQGLGLAICHDLAQAYGCELTLLNAVPHGLRACLRWQSQIT